MSTPTQAVEKAIRAAEEATAATEAARAARDEAIRDARASGARPVELARASRLSRSTIHAALRAQPGAARGGDPLARAESAARAWREAQAAERHAHDTRNAAIAEALDAATVQPATVRRMTGWGEARVYQVRDLGRVILAERG